MRTDPSPANEDALAAGLRALFSRFGYRRYRMNRFEDYDLYVENRPFLPGDSIITFSGSDGRLMALRPDVTLSIARHSAAGRDTVQKLFYHENVYRADRASGEFREIMQVGLEALGSVDLYTEAEVILLAAESLDYISGDSLLSLSHMGFLTALMREAGLPEERRGDLLALIGARNLPGLREFCRREGLPDGQICELASLYGSARDMLPKLRTLASSPEAGAAADELEGICRALSLSGFGDRVMLDFSVINDLNYYNGVIFQGCVNGVFSPVLSGGRYDHLMKKFGRDAGAIGFAVYLSQLDRLLYRTPPCDADLLLLYGDDDRPDRISQAMRKLTGLGYSVQAQRAVPPGLRFRRVIRLDELPENTEDFSLE